ncbi:hypothetical protein LB515_25005 [Mesorhizobium sp. CA15]|uniref:hypothetical protein n=1 Tax=Mesorhizobium sp. CA15 TaxID=2876641 RepID=UPI001CD1344E|nr:hypothetical protein [Mesorhizobium sp. CA15]MBZ9868645.1 hypothetical protein [Mesorhizobium sp. CA15]
MKKARAKYSAAAVIRMKIPITSDRVKRMSARALARGSGLSATLAPETIGSAFIGSPCKPTTQTMNMHGRLLGETREFRARFHEPAVRGIAHAVALLHDV